MRLGEDDELVGRTQGARLGNALLTHARTGKARRSTGELARGRPFGSALAGPSLAAPPRPRSDPARPHARSAMPRETTSCSAAGALEILPVFPAFDVVVVRGILEVRVNLGTLEGLDGFDALGACSALGFGANLGACWRTDLRGFGLKAGEPDAGRVRLLGSGLLVESVTCAGPFLSGNM